MLALSQKRRRQEDEEDAQRRQRYWDWRAMNQADYNPVYPFIPPPTPGSDVIIPIPMPPFFSDIDFYLSSLSVLNIRTSAPIIHTINGLALNLGTGLKLENGKLTVEGGGPGGKTYTGTAPITVNNVSNTISLNYGSGLQVVNGALQASQTSNWTAVAPLQIAGNIILANYGSGLKLNSSQALEVFLGTGLRFDGSGAIELADEALAVSRMSQDLTAESPLHITNSKIALRYESPLTVIDDQNLTVTVEEPLIIGANAIELSLAPSLTKTPYGALSLTTSNTLAVPENAAAEVRCVEPLEGSSSGLMLNYDSTTLAVENNKLKVKAAPVVYQTLANSPIQLQSTPGGEQALCDIKMIRLGPNVLVDMYINGSETSTGTQTWTIQFDGESGTCLTGTMVVCDGQGNKMDNVLPSFVLCATQLGTDNQRMRGFEPIVCSEAGVFKESTYCSWWVYKSTNMYIELKSTTTNCKPIFKISFMYEAEHGMV